MCRIPGKILSLKIRRIKNLKCIAGLSSISWLMPCICCTQITGFQSTASISCHSGHIIKLGLSLFVMWGWRIASYHWHTFIFHAGSDDKHIREIRERHVLPHDRLPSIWVDQRHPSMADHRYKRVFLSCNVLLLYQFTDILSLGESQSYLKASSIPWQNPLLYIHNTRSCNSLQKASPLINMERP